LNQWARLEEQSFGEPERARGIYARALALKPEDSEALASSVRLAVNQSDWADAARNLEKQRELAAGDERAKKDLELAELYTDRLSRPRDAFTALESALELGAEPGQVISIAQRLMDRDEVRGDVARLLSSQYEAQGDARQEALAVAALLREITEPSENIALFHRLANVYEHKLGEPSGALDAVLQGLARHPTELELWDRADDLALRTRRSTALAESYRNALRTSLSTEIERELATRAARVHEESLGDLLGAVPYYERLLALDPDDERAFVRLKEILTASERWGELEALYERAEARLEDPIRKAEMLAEVALIADEIIDDPEKAAGYYERIVAYDPVHAVGLETLDRLYVRLGRKKSLAGVLDRRLELAAGDQLNELRVRAARLALELHDPQRSIELVEEALADQPNNYAARELCEQLVEVGNVRVRAARALESVYELRDEVRELVRVLGVRIESLRSPGEAGVGEPQPTEAEREDERRELLRRVATLRSDRLHDDEGSFDAFAELAPLDPLDGELRDRLVDAGRRLGRHARVAEVLTATADAADAAPLKGEILMQVAGIQRDHLGDLAAAEASYRRVLTIDENDPDLVLPSARALEAMFQASGRSKELVDVLRLQVKLEPDSDRRNMLLARVGELSSEVLGDTAGAIEAWEARLEDNPDDLRALAALDELYARAERYQDLVRVLERRRELATGEGDRRRFLERQAQVQKDQLGAVSDAITSYQTLLDEFGPESTVFGALEGLYRKTERWDELNEIYERHIDVTETESTRLEALAALGTLRRDQLGDLSGALDAYRRALSLDSSHQPSRTALDAMLEAEDRGARAEAAEILRPIFETEGDHARLLHVVEIEAELADDPSEKLDKLELATRIAEDALGDVVRACGYAERAVREAAAQGELRPQLATLDRLAALAQRRRAQAAVLEEIAPELFDGDLQIEVIRRVAELYRRELGDTERARELYRKAVELRSDDTASLVALEELYAEADDSEHLLDILQRRAEVAASDEERRALAYRQAELLSDKLKQPAKAIEVYESIIDLSLHARAVSALSSLYAAAERWDDLVALLSRRIDDGDGNEADLRAELARIVSERSGDVERALDELEQVLARDPQHVAAVELLEKIQKSATEPGQRARAAALLEPVYLVRADYDSVAATLRTRLESVETPDERRDLVTRLAQIHEEQKEDYLGALEISAQLLDEDLSDQGTVAELERLAKVAGAEKRLAEIYATALSKVDVDDEGSARLSQRAAELFEQAGNDERALAQYKRALAFSPENERLFRSVDAILKRAANHEARVALYREALEHRFDPAERVPLLHVIAGLERDQLGRLPSAIETYEEVLGADEHDVPALEALTELYAKTEKWESLAELYQRRAENASAADGARYRLALADLLDRRLEAPDRAVDQLEEIVRDLPSHKEALAALEAYRSRPTLRERVVEILRPLYESADDWKRLIKLNEDRFALARESSDKVAVLRETAELWEVRGQDAGRARLVLGEALHLEPDEPAVREDFERLTELTDSHAELAETYEAILEAQPEVLSRRDYLAKLAEVYDRRLDDPRRALWAYSGLHELESGELAPVESMEKLALLLSDWVVLARALEAKADLVFDEEERADAWRRIGEIRHEMLEDDEGALTAYERAFELDQTNAPTSDRLIELYEQKGDAARLVDLYQTRVELASEAETDLKFQLLLRAATRFESDLRDRPRAIESLSRALVLRPGSSETLQDLNRLYRAEEMWPELLDNLRLEASSEAEPERRLSLRREVARTLSEKLESHEEAIDAYRLVLEERPEDVVSLDAVTRLASEHEHLRAYATDVLIPVLQQTGLRQRLVDALEMRLGTESEPSVRAETLRTIARVQEADLNQPKAALETLLRALAERPELLELHDAIERLAEQTGAWSSYVGALEERGAEAYDPYVAKDLLVRAGKLAEERLGDVGRAIKAYVRAAEQAGDQPDLLEALDRLYSAGGRTEDLLGVLDRRLALEDSDQRQAELHYRIGRLKLAQKEPAEALGSLRSALERDKNHTGASESLEQLLSDDSLFEEAFQILEDVYRERGETGRLAGLYERRVAKAKLPAERIDMRRGLARVLEDDCRDPAAAQKVLQQGLSDDPTDTGLHDEIERLAPLTGDWAGAAQALLAAASAPKLPPDSGRELCVRAATWLRDKVGDRGAAEAAFARASALEPENDDVLAELEALQDGAGRERDLIATLERRARLALDDSRRLDMYQRAKELADRVGDATLGESILRQVVEFDDGNLWALEGLTEARRAAGDYSATFALLQKRIDLEASASQVRALRFDAAAIALGPLADPKQATKLYEDLFEDEPMDRTASGALRKCYEQAGRWDDLGRLSERLIDMADDGAERSARRVELARLKLGRLQDESGAVELLQAVLEEEPSHTEAVVALSELFEKAGRNEELAELLEREVEAARQRGDAAAEVRLLGRLAVVFDQKLGVRDKAIEAYEHVLAREPNDHAALDALVRLRLAGDETAEAAALLERLVGGLSGAEAVTRGVELAGLHRKLGSGERAAVALERALAVEPANSEVRKALHAQHEANGSWDKVAALLVQDADAAVADKERVQLLCKAARLHSSKRADHGAAADLLARASQLVPDDRELLLELCDEYSASGRGNDAVAALERVVESFNGKRTKELADIHRRLATAYLSQGNREKALDELNKAFRIEPGNLHVLKQLGEVALEMGDLKKAQQMFLALRLQKLEGDSPISKGEVLLRLGQVHQKLGEDAKAKQMYERALQADESLEEAKRGIAELS
jgi:tetratricopeptide (TPR) repeat protein